MASKFKKLEENANEEAAIKGGGVAGLMSSAKTVATSIMTSAKTNFETEGTMKTFIAMMVLGTLLIAVVIGSGISALKYVGVCGVFSGAMWMPYLMALIFFNTDSGKKFSGLYKKLAYAPLPAQTPPWVKRAMVAHNNSLENFMLFATAVFFALQAGVSDDDLVVPAIAYFVCRVYYYIFTVGPEVFMLKTAFWCMGWAACTIIFVMGLMA